MKGTFIMVLAVAFTMLVIPLFSIPKEKDAVLQTVATNNTIKHEKNDNNISFDSFKVFKDNKILQLSAADYIFGVVAAEMPALYHEEALKAQAVAAYTFACYRKTNSTNTEYDITADGDTAQCFITREEAAERWGEKADEYAQKIENCIAAVQDELLIYENEPIFAAYHAISPGTTNSCADVWAKNLPYLKSVNSAGDTLADGYLSEVSFSVEELCERLNSITAASGEPQTYFSNAKTTDNGYVKEISFCGKVISGSQICKLLSLRSSNFTISFADGIFTFAVKGYGHGVGMSQTGADYMAKQGSSYKEILLHYYNGATLQKN